MATLNPYILFSCNCRQAMEFYHKALGGDLKIQTIGETPMASQMPKEQASQIMHSQLDTPQLRLMASDMGDEQSQTETSRLSLMLYCESEQEINALFSAFLPEAKETTPLRKEFWGAIYGEILDNFGIRWMFNCDA